jgi:gamma-glutamyltranspeptidase/glutathione hydrolase
MFQRSSRTVLTVLQALALAVTACAGAHTPMPPPAAAAKAAGAVASAEGAATDAGLRILGAGGNAADAAVAVALALAVVQPHAGNLGGGGFALVRFQGAVSSLDFRETAPAAATAGMFQGPDGKALPEGSLVGPLASGIPGSPAGLRALHERFGRAPWASVVAPAIALARDGFPVTQRLHDAVAAEKKGLARFPETAAVWLPGGEPPAVGTRVRLPELAATLEAYAGRGPAAIMEGPVAQAVVRASAAHGGILTETDLAGYRPVWREPLRFQAFGWEIASMPLPSSGGLILAESMAMLGRLDWPATPRTGTMRAHLLAETWRRAFADRYLLGDPARTRADAIQLLDPAYIAQRAAGIDRSRATPSDEVRPWPDEVPAGRGGETTHLSVADGDGNVVALTTTINGWFGCYLLVPGAGFFLNNEMDDFATIPDQPNLFGLIQGDANAVAPGARMLSSMSPTIAWHGGEVLALGSPGGSRIPTATLQVLLDLIVDRDTLQAAITRPRLHHQWRPDEIRYEPGALSESMTQELLALGHHLRAATGSLGEVHVVHVRQDGSLEAAADARGPGSAAVR